MIFVVTPNPCLDRTLFVERNLPQGKIMVREVREIAGGKGSNVCRVLREFGVPCRHLLFLGGYTGKRVKELLDEEGIETEVVWTSSPTRVVTTVVDSRWEQTVYFDPPPHVTEGEREVFLRLFASLAEEASLITFCGSVPPAVISLYQELFEKIQAKPVIVDTRGEALRGWQRYPWGIKMNREEAELTLGEPLQSIDAWKNCFDFWLEKGVEIVMITLGEKGVIGRYRTSFYRVFSPPIQAINPVGSGDAFLAGFLVGWWRGETPEETLRLAVAAGVSNALRWDAGRVEREEVMRLSSEVRIARGDTLKEVWEDGGELRSHSFP